MAELAIGVVSLGIQVASGVQKYLSGLDARAEELQAAHRLATTMSELLERARLVTAKIPDAQLIVASVSTCEAQIQALQDLLSELTESKPVSASLRYKMQERGRKLMYPFHRPALGALEARLAEVNGSLQTSLLVADLEMTLETREISMVATRNLSHLVTLLSKPSYLREVADGHLDRRSTVPHFRPLPSTSCQCQRARTSTTEQRDWGYWRFYWQHSIENTHIPGCRLSKIVRSEKTRRVGVQYYGLGRLLNTAIQVSLTMANGAGGCSITPSIIFSPVVDRLTAPTFKLLDLAYRIFRGPFLRGWPPRGSWQQIQEIVNGCLDGLALLYSRRRASPRDFDVNGRSVMHDFVILMWLPSEKLRSRVHSLLKNGTCRLMAYGVPVTRHGDNHESVLQNFDFTFPESLFWVLTTFRLNLVSTILNWIKPSLHTVETATMLIRDGYHSASPESLAPPSASSLMRCTQIFKWSSQLASGSYSFQSATPSGFRLTRLLVFDVGPLSQAVIRGDRLAAERLVRDDPSSIRERSLLGQSPLHLSVQDPQCLRLLLDNGLKQCIDTVDNKRSSPIYYALHDNAFESAEILISSGCALSLELLRDLPRSKYQPELLNCLVNGLKERRERLKALGRRHLTSTQVKDLGLFEERILDIKAPHVIECLQEIGVDVPSELVPYPKFGSIRATPPAGVYLTSYRYFCHDYESNTGVLSALWDAGFRDVDGASLRGISAVMSDVMSGVWVGNFGLHVFLDRTNWLLEHGCDIWTPFGDRDSLRRVEKGATMTPAHFLLARIGQCLERAEREDQRVHAQLCSLLRRCLVRRPVDDCFCHCSNGGSTPLDELLKWLCLDGSSQSSHSGNGTRDLADRRQPRDICRIMTRFACRVSSVLSPADLERAVRVLTFQALELDHTCCDFVLSMGPFQIREMSLERIEETNNEQAHLVETTEETVAYLIREFRQQDSTGQPIGFTEPEEFWTRRWLPKITEVIRVIDSRTMSEDQIRAAEDIGVVWHGPEPPPPEKVREPTIEDFREELRNIIEMP